MEVEGLVIGRQFVGQNLLEEEIEMGRETTEIVVTKDALIPGKEIVVGAHRGLETLEEVVRQEEEETVVVGAEKELVGVVRLEVVDQTVQQLGAGQGLRRRHEAEVLIAVVEVVAAAVA